MDKLIPIINKLQDVFNTVNSQPVDLPQIAVVGSQSTGKSSVLESLVGRDFLPRGNGICTRRPLVLQLINTGEGGAEWAEFLHKEGVKFSDFNEVRKEIERETERIAPGKGISHVAINLRVFSPTVLNMTMIDLPGLTKVAVGNQPADIDQQIREMVLKFIARPNCIILAVSAANVDLANSDSIQLAKEVDPEGNRTFGVLTKVDLMDHGTNCLGILQGKVIPLKMGYTAVKNRSQRDIAEGKPIDVALKEEREFFIKHPAYCTMSESLGYGYLSREMNKILINHIKRSLPALKLEIHNTVQHLQSELKSYGETLIDGVDNQGALLLHLLSKFANSFSAAIDGNDLGDVMQVRDELFGGARIINIFYVVFKQELDMIGPFTGLRDDQIRIAIKNSCGARLALFVPDRAFEILVKQQIQKLRHPCVTCVERIAVELQKVAQQCETTDIKRFRYLHEQLSDVVKNMMRRFLDPTVDYVNQILDVELAYINMKHPDLISGTEAAANAYASVARRKDKAKEARPESAPKKKALKPKDEGRGIMSFFGAKESKSKADRKAEPVPEKKKPAPLPMSAREQGEVRIIKSLLESYFNIVKKQVADQTPKAIMHFLVNQTKEHLQSELVSKLYKEGQFEALLSESPEIAHKRKQCRDLLVVMKKALEIVSEVRDYDKY